MEEMEEEDMDGEERHQQQNEMNSGFVFFSH